VETKPDSLRLILLLATFFGAAGCQATTIDVRGKDVGVFFPSFRAAVNLAPESPKNVQFEGELDYWRGAGQFTRTVEAGEFLRLSQIVFVGPAEIEADARLQAISLSAKLENHEFRYFRPEMIGGLAAHVADLELSSGGIVDRDRTVTVGPIVGLQLGVEPVRWVLLYGRASVTFGFGPDLSEVKAGEFGVSVRPVPLLALSGGWRAINYEASQTDGADLFMKLSGPWAGLQVDF
jgi:hypothetical protein